MIGVSIVIPTYKRSKQTEKCIRLILKSSDINKVFKPEIIIVDDTPNNSIKKIINKFSKSDVDFSYIKPKKRAGIAKSRNIGIKKAKYKIIISTDTDIEVERNTILNTIKTLKATPTAGMISGNAYWKGKKELDRPRKYDDRFRYKNVVYIEALLGRYVAFYKKLFSNVGGFDTIFAMHGEGSDLSIKFWRAGYPLVYEPKIKVHHVFNVEHTVTRNIPDKNDKILRSLLLLSQKYDAKLDRNLSSKLGWTKKEYDLVIFTSLSKSLKWISKHYKKLEKQKSSRPNSFNFNPFYVFSNKKMLINCITSTKKRLRKIREMSFNL